MDKHSPFTPEGELWILAANGMAYWPDKPRREVIDIRVIAQSLSQKVRFGGHGRPFYSVAQHSVLVRQLVQLVGAERISKNIITPAFTERTARQAQMHDAHEAWLVDLPSPLKKQPAIHDWWRALEHAWDSVIFERFDIEPDASSTAFVKQMDLTAMRIEGEVIMPTPPADWEWPGHGASSEEIISLADKYKLIAPASPAIRAWGWEEAEQRFLDMWWGQ